MKTLFAMLGLGLIPAVLCLMAGALVMGMGHGWGLPLEYAFLSFGLYPLAMARWGWIDRDTPWGRDAVLTAVLAGAAAATLLGSRAMPPPASPVLEAFILLGLPALYWIVGAALRRSRRQAAFGDAVLLALGLALDVAAWLDAVSPDQLRSTAFALTPWLPLWLGWQAIVAAALYRHTRPPNRDRSAERSLRSPDR